MHIGKIYIYNCALYCTLQHCLHPIYIFIKKTAFSTDTDGMKKEPLIQYTIG